MFLNDGGSIYDVISAASRNFEKEASFPALAFKKWANQNISGLTPSKTHLIIIIFI